MASLDYRREIDGLRAIAVAAVVLYHADAALLPGGFVGVDVFFVISGYLITSLLSAEWRDSGRIDLVGFYVRRVRRLMPALCLVIAAVLVMSALWFAQSGSPMYRVTDSALASLAFLANFYFEASTGGYFDGPADRMPLLHLWSLAVEEQYYLVYPLLLWALMARTGARTVPILVLLSLASLLLAEHWLQVDAAKAFYQMPARFWELAAGGIVAFAGQGKLGARLPAWLAAMGVLVVLAACVLTSESGHFPGAGALPPVVGAVLILWAIHDSKDTGFAGRILRSRPFVFVGLLSYSFYLWHWPLLAFDSALTLDDSPLAWRLALCALALLLAWSSWRWVETPIRRMKSVPARKVFVTAGLAITLVAALAVTLGSINLSSSEVSALADRTRNDRPANMQQCHFGLNSRVQALQSAECQSRSDIAPRVAIWGDSHALAWQPFAWGLAESRAQAAIGFTMDACPPAPGYSGQRTDYPGHGANCARFNALALDRLADGGFDRVVISARWLSWFPVGEQVPARDGDRPMARQALAAAVSSAVERLRGVPEVFLIAPVPVMRHDPATCIAMGRVAECAMSRADFDRAAAPARRLLAGLARANPNVTIVDPTNYFCDAVTCPVMKNGRALFWDDDHVATSAAGAFVKSYLDDPSRYTAESAEPAASGATPETP